MVLSGHFPVCMKLRYDDGFTKTLPKVGGRDFVTGRHAYTSDLAPPGIDELFTFMRDAERRFETLRMRIEERVYGARGEQFAAMEVAVAADTAVVLDDVLIVKRSRESRCRPPCFPTASTIP